MSTKSSARFKITSWDEKPTQEFADGGKISVAHVAQEYMGDIDGAGSVSYVMHYADAGTATFVGIEVIDATIQGKAGQFVIRHDGVFEKGAARSTWTIVPGTGRRQLEGISGSGSFVAGQGGEAKVVFNFSFK